VSDGVVKSAIKRIFETGDAGELVELEESMDELEEMVSKVLSEEPALRKEIESQPKAINFLVGRIIKETEGRYDARRIAEVIRSRIDSK
ncbi:MAG TPA: hypothetical protein VMW02_00855, partial [Thermoplasmata archaeon]|nr:hypothetical protein [Thermoplasmata archaeon]